MEATKGFSVSLISQNQLITGFQREKSFSKKKIDGNRLKWSIV